MNIIELEKKLLAEGYNPGALFLTKEIHPLDQGVLITKTSDGMWTAEYQERGERSILFKCNTESEICEKVYDYLSPKRRSERNKTI